MTISPKTVSDGTVPADPSSSISAVLAKNPQVEPSADPPAPSAETLERAAEEQSEDAAPSSAIAPVEELDELSLDTEPIIADAPLADEPVSETLESVAVSGAMGDEQGKSHAQTIDEAIADFHIAVKTPEPESSLAPEGLSAVEIDETSVPLDTPALETKPSELAPNPTMNGDSLSHEDSDPVELAEPVGEEMAPTKSAVDVSATAPRTVSRTPVPIAKDATVESNHEGEGNTMEDIEID